MLNKIVKVLNDLKIIRRLTLFWLIWLTTVTYKWIFNFVEGMDTIDPETASILIAILGPISALQAAAVKFYSDSRNKEITNGS